MRIGKFEKERMCELADVIFYGPQKMHGEATGASKTEPGLFQAMEPTDTPSLPVRPVR